MLIRGFLDPVIEILDLFHKNLSLDGLGDVTVKTGGQQTVAIAPVVEDGHRDDGDLAQNRI